MGRVFFNTRENVQKIDVSYQCLASDSGKIFSLDSAAAVVVTLPIDSNALIGWNARFIVQTANDLAYTIFSGDGTDSGGDDFVGAILLQTTTAADSNYIAPAANDAKIVLDANLADTGGNKGSYVDIIKLATNEWMVSGIVYSSDADSTGAALFIDG